MTTTANGRNGSVLGTSPEKGKEGKNHRQGEGTETQAGTRRDRAGEPATRDEKDPGTGSQDKGEPGQQGGLTYRVENAGSLVGALSLLLGTRVVARLH